MYVPTNMPPQSRLLQLAEIHAQQQPEDRDVRDDAEDDVVDDDRTFLGGSGRQQSQVGENGGDEDDEEGGADMTQEGPPDQPFRDDDEETEDGEDVQRLSRHGTSRAGAHRDRPQCRARRRSSSGD
jgi:hypothetical protein